MFWWEKKQTTAKIDVKNIIQSEPEHSEKKLKEIIDFVFTGQDLETELLLGPAYAIAKLFERNKMSFEDVDVFEIYEAFAGQVLANINALASEDFAKENLGRDAAVGQLPMDKLNNWGGSLSIGHPFGATGARLLNTTANRLHIENGHFVIDLHWPRSRSYWGHDTRAPYFIYHIGDLKDWEAHRG